MSAEAEDTNSRNVSASAWNTPVTNGGVAVTTSPISADSWPSLSETANAPRRPPPSQVSLRNNVTQTQSVRPSSSHNGANNRVRGRHNSTRNHTQSLALGQSHRQNPLSPQARQAPEVSARGGAHYNNNSRAENGLRSVNNNPSQHRDSHRRNNNAPPPPTVHGSHAKHRTVESRAPVVNSHLGYNARPGLVQPPPPPFPGSHSRPSFTVLPYLPTPLPVPQTHFMPFGFHPVTGQPVFYGPPLIPPLSMRPHPLYAPPVPQSVEADLMKQIEYYFSDDNLVKDVYFRTKMDAQGWVLVTTIAEFNQVKDITARAKEFIDTHEIDVSQFILNVMRNSQFVEVEEYNLRKRRNWEKYVLRNVVEYSSSAVETPGHVETTVLKEKPIHSNSV